MLKMVRINSREMFIGTLLKPSSKIGGFFQETSTKLNRHKDKICPMAVPMIRCHMYASNEINNEHCQYLSDISEETIFNRNSTACIPRLCSMLVCKLMT